MVIRPGAVLDASGTSALIDPNAGRSPTSFAAGAPFMLASNGGSISLDSLAAIYNDGTLRAPAGGVGASGGSLSITIEDGTSPSVLEITQGVQPSGLSSNLAPGTADPGLQFGSASVSADAISAGGFDNVSLYGRDVIQFAGNVTLRAGQSIKFYQGVFSDTISTATVNIEAPYVLFGGFTPVVDNSGTSTLLAAHWSPSTPNCRRSARHPSRRNAGSRLPRR